MEEKKDKVTKRVSKEEDRQLKWFFFWIVLIFAIFIGTYSLIESKKSFEYSNITWEIEKYENLDIYHGRFKVLNGLNTTFNIFHRTDPRENDVLVGGELSDFKFGGYISFSPEVDNCRGEVARSMVDLGSFLKVGVGTGTLEAATTSAEIYNQTGRVLIDCRTNDRTIVIMNLGNESSIKKSFENPYCYTITVKDCNDLAPVEKFIVKSVEDFREKYG